MSRFLILTRDEQTADGVFGWLTFAGSDLKLRTMEDDWLDNAPGKSCIPAGSYTLRRTIFHKHNVETFEVAGVPGRSRILIHVANTEEDVEGCIGVGTREGRLWVARDEDTGAEHVLKRAVVESGKAFQLFMHDMEGADEATLTIVWAPGLPNPNLGA